jgi:predicted RND superfamily exporter protein
MFDALLARFARFVTQRRGLTLALVFAAVAAAGAQLPALRADFTPQDLFTTYEAGREEAERFKATFGQTDNVLLLLVEAEDVLSVEALGHIHLLSTLLAAAPFAERVDSITATSVARSDGPGVLRVGPLVEGTVVDEAARDVVLRALDESALLRGRLVGSGGRLAAIAVLLDRSLTRIEPVGRVVDEVRATLAANPPPDGVSVRLAGLPYIRAYVTDAFFQDQLRLVPLALLVSLIIQALAFRWLPGVAFPGVAVLLGAIVVLGGMAAVGEPLNIINQVVPILILIIGTSDAIHLVSRYREEAATSPPQEAGRRTVRAMVVACFLTSFTTAVGFGSLAVSKTEILVRFGVTAALGVLAAYAVTITALPPLLTFAKGKARPADAAHDGPLERALVAVTDAVLRRPKTMVAVSLVVLGGAGLLASRVKVDTFLLETFREGDAVWETTRLVEDELNGVLPVELSLSAEAEGGLFEPSVANAVQRVAAWARTQDGVLSATTYTDLLDEARVAYSGDTARRGRAFRSRAEVAQLAELLAGARPSPLEPFLTADRRQARVALQIRDIGAVRVLALGEALLGEVRSAFEGIDGVTVTLTGDAYVGSIGLDSLIRDMVGSLAMAFVFIFGIMAVMFRSVRLGLISVLPNTIPLAITCAWMTLTGTALNTTTVVIFSISLGLAVDDTIHYLARYNEEQREGHHGREAIRRAAAGAGRAIIVTTMILAAGLFVLSFSTFVPIMQFGVLLTVTVVACVFGDLLLLPALLALWGPERARMGASPS